MYPDGYPDFPMPQQLRTDGDGHKVLVSCLVSDLVFEWRLEPLGERTRIAVHVEIPEAEAAPAGEPARRGAHVAALPRRAGIAPRDAPPARC